MSNEHAIQNQGRNALAGLCLCFRVNIGQAWTGSECIRLRNGDMLIKQPRPFSTGLPAGFSDTFGVVPVKITQDMVGRTIGQFFGVEYKSETGRPTKPQQAFLGAITANGGRAGIARSAADAVGIVMGPQT
jgi:hypothetical protein